MIGSVLTESGTLGSSADPTDAGVKASHEKERTMRIEVDAALCSGQGRCADLAPDVYSLDDKGYCAITELDVPEELHDGAVRGAQAGPERAISVRD